MSVAAEHRAIDANVILRYLLRDNEDYWPRAKSVFDAIEAGRLTVHCDPVILSEVVYVMQNLWRVPRKSIAERLMALLKSDGITMPRKDHYLLALEIYRTTTAHFGDACASVTALEECDGELLSFDRKLSSLAGIVRTEEISD